MCMAQHLQGTVHSDNDNHNGNDNENHNVDTSAVGASDNHG